jgi:transcriptional regulator with XRE-family HTH domain
MERDQPEKDLKPHLHLNAKSVVRNFVRIFGEEVKTRRLRLGLKQEDLAAIVQSYGLQGSQSYLSRLESGQRGEPSIQLVVILAVVLDISLDAIILRAQNSKNDS